MSNLIERQAAIEAVAELQGRAVTKAELKGISKAWKWIKALPPAQPERNTGTWVFVRGEEAGNALYMCSACGKGDIHAPEVKVSYCWNCGAEMTQEGGS